MHCLWEIIDNAVDEALAGARDPDRRRPARRRLRRGPRPRPWHPGRHRTADRPLRGRGGVHQAARRRQVRRQLLRGLRWPARRRRLGRQRAVRPPRRRGRPRRQDLRDELPPRRARHLRRPRGHEPDAPFTPFVEQRAARSSARSQAGVTGTRVRYWADRQIFMPGRRASPTTSWSARARQTVVPRPRADASSSATSAAAGTPGATAARGDVPSTTAASPSSSSSSRPTRRSPTSGGCRARAPSPRRSRCSTTRATWRRPSSSASCEVDIALRWGTGYDTTVRSLRQHHRDAQGRHPRAGFEPGAGQGRSASRSSSTPGGSRSASDKVEKDDILAGPDRRRDGPAGRAAVRGPDQGGPRHLGGARASSPGSSSRSSPTGSPPRQARREGAGAPLLEKVVAEMKSRICARRTRRRSGARTRSSPPRCPAKLADCRTDDVARTRAVHRRGRLGARHGQAGPVVGYQALLPIRGKILNVQKASIADMLKNAECAAIIQVIGAGSGRTFDLDSARYGKVIIMTRRRRRRRPHPDACC